MAASIVRTLQAEIAPTKIEEEQPAGDLELAALPYAIPEYPSATSPPAEYARDHPEQLQKLASEAKVLLHGRTRWLIEEFLALKRHAGSSHERRLFHDMDSDTFVLRLLQKRPLTFCLPSDVYLLRDGESGEGGFESVGMEDQMPPLMLDEVISHDEMAISALISVSTRTLFFNNGARDNEGRSGDATTYPFEGIYTGAVGARFEREYAMESAHMVVTPQQNSPDNGYGADASGHRADVLTLWAKFYGLACLPDWEQAQLDWSAYVSLQGGALLDARIYKQRLLMSIEPFLLDADRRAGQAPNGAYVHVVGLGIGAWAVEPVA